MKKFTFMLFIIIVFLSYTYGDVIPENHHVVGRAVTIANCNAYKDFQLVGYITGPMIQGYTIFEIRENVILEKGYKFNTFKVYAFKTSLVEQWGGLTAIDFSRIIQSIQPAAIIDPGTYTVPNTNPLIKESVVYKIAGIRDNTVILYIAERKLEFNNGLPAKIETYTYNP